MATTKRISLAERQRLAAEELEARAAATDSVEPVTTSTPAEPELGDQASAQPSAPSRRRKTTQQIAKEQGKFALGIYFPDAEVLDLARRAFVTDFWEHEGPDTFAEWISQAILAHARRTYVERDELARPRPARQSGGRGKLRKIDVRPEVRQAVEDGMSQDRTKLRRQISMSSWCGDAVAAAIETAKDRTEGELMEIDGQLPPRLRK